ncbi:hypothetical protein Trydic_g21363 [Trypoxylus dichotomus]
MENNKTWSGSSMDDLYENNGPYCFTYEPVLPSKDHAVLYELPVTLTSPPKPHRNKQTRHWENDYVKLPYSVHNVFADKDENGEKTLKSRWEVIENSLLQSINSSQELEAAIRRFNTHLPPFGALHYFFEEVLDAEEGEVFFTDILPGIIQLALQLPDILPGNLPLLQKGLCASISLSQIQIASLLANGFLCTFPWRKDVSNTYPGLNFSRLFSAHYRPKRINCVVEKIKAICHYFRRVLTKVPIGTVTFERKFLQRNQFPRWDQLNNNLGNTKIHICSNGTIENNGDGLLQVDFANKFVGGGVLAYGCVQEEIRFIICPELIVSRLFTEELNANEALLITGAERYSNYSGYGDTFTWEGDYIDQTPYDCYGRRKTSIVAIDATKFNKASDQFNTSVIIRELNKAYVGFHSNLTGKLAPVATGNWGCGAFRGDPNLKSLIQLMACSAAKRNMVYYTFGNVDLEKTIYDLYMFFANNKVTICELWRSLCRFIASNNNQHSFVPYIQQSFLDLHKQPSITHFFESSYKNLNSTRPCTSSETRARTTSTKSPKKEKKPAAPSASASASDSHKSKNSPTKFSSADNAGQKFLERTIPFDDASRESFAKTIPVDKATRKSPTKIHSAKATTALVSNADQKSPVKSILNCATMQVDNKDVVDIIRIIDGDVNEKNEENMVKESLLTSLDSFSRHRAETASGRCEDVEAEDYSEMEVDEDIERPTTVPRHKISDYFVKITK